MYETHITFYDRVPASPSRIKDVERYDCPVLEQRAPRPSISVEKRVEVASSRAESSSRYPHVVTLCWR
jgi:hypothetical protein